MIIIALIPLIRILEEEFNFGRMTTFGTPETLSMTLVNESAI